MKIITFAIIILVLFIVLSACSLQKDNDRYTGIQANESVVSSIRQDIEDKENSLLANENNVFWTESGKLWHKSYDCSYLANSKTVLHGTLEEAKLEGKEKRVKDALLRVLTVFTAHLRIRNIKWATCFL